MIMVTCCSHFEDFKMKKILIDKQFFNTFVHYFLQLLNISKDS